MTIEELIQKYRRQQKELTESQAYFLAASTAHADMVERIFTDGNATDGNPIGVYDTTKEMYVNPINAPRGFTPEGKTGQQVFKNGNKHRTKYFKSYRDFRANQQRETGFVNLQLFGNLMSDFSTSLRRVSNTIFESRPRRKENEGKIIGNQRRFQKVIFGATEKERETYRETLNFEINKILNA